MTQARCEGIPPGCCRPAAPAKPEAPVKAAVKKPCDAPPRLQSPARTPAPARRSAFFQENNNRRGSPCDEKVTVTLGLVKQDFEFKPSFSPAFQVKRWAPTTTRTKAWELMRRQQATPMRSAWRDRRPLPRRPGTVEQRDAPPAATW